MRELVKQDEVKDSIQELYSTNKSKELDFKSLYQAIFTTLYYLKWADIIECLKYMSLAHSQYYLQNIEDDNNFVHDFLSDIDLSSISLHTAIYPRIMTDFTLEDTALWKKIANQALIRKIDLVEIEIDIVNISTLLQVFV